MNWAGMGDCVERRGLFLGLFLGTALRSGRCVVDCQTKEIAVIRMNHYCSDIDSAFVGVTNGIPTRVTNKEIAQSFVYINICYLYYLRTLYTPYMLYIICMVYV